MANPPVRLLSYDAVSGDLNTPLPFRGLTCGSGLNGQGGALTCAIDVSDPGVKETNPWAATTPGKTVLVVELDGQVLEAYDLTPRDRKRSTPTVITIDGAPQLWNYFANARAQVTDYSTPPNSPLASPMKYWTAQSWDATLIATQVFMDVIANRLATGGVIGWNTSILGTPQVLINGLPPSAAEPVIPSSNWVAPTFPFSSVQMLGAIFQQLSGYGYLDGFDFNFNVNYSGKPGSPLVGVLNLWYPRAGRTFAQSGLSFNMNLSREADFAEDASQQGTTIIETGVQGGIWIEDNVYPIDQGWPIRDKIVSHSGAIGPNLVALLGAAAQSDSYLASFPPVAPVITMDLADLDPSLLTIGLGDDAILNDLPSDQFPAGFNARTGEWRIVSWKLNYPDEGDATVDFTLNVPPAATAVGPALYP